MFKPHYGICSSDSCSRKGQKVPIVVKKGLCDQCNYLEKQSKKRGKITAKELPKELKEKITNYDLLYGNKEKTKRKKPVKKVRKTTGELEVFKTIYSERVHICISCRVWLSPDPKAGYFSHVLPKSIYGRFRLKKENIVLMCLDCHYQWDHGDREQDKFKEVRELAEKLKREYNLNT